MCNSLSPKTIAHCQPFPYTNHIFSFHFHIYQGETMPTIRRLVLSLLILTGALMTGQNTCRALARPDVEFKVFQFPPDMIPRIDGDTGDWDMVTGEYVIGSDQLADNKTEGALKDAMDTADLDVRVRVGWVKGLDRLYFLYEAFDDDWNMFYKRGDIFEVVVDADLSGGQYGTNPQLDADGAYFGFKGVHAQNYHIFTPAGEGRDWALIPGCNPWIRELPWANCAYSYSFREGEAGRLVCEFWITPFDYAPYDGPERAVVSKLAENTVIGLSWAVLDYDGSPPVLDGFWNLSHDFRMASDASALCVFRLMPLEPAFSKPLAAEWDFTVLDRAERLVAFTDRSTGDVTSWLWDFDDGATSTERAPVHRYAKPGEYTVVLTVKGPEGEAKRIKVRDVVFRK